jgi:hypothetical protein
MNNLAIDPLWIWIAVGVVALLIVAGLVSRGARRSRSESLQEKFGGEYDHAVHEHGSRKKAEADLVERAEQVKKYNIVPLSASDAGRFRSDWLKVEQHFLERPTTAVVEADELVADIMRTRGYPMGDFDRHASDLSVTHPSVIDHYRAGHKVIGEAPGSASTEDLRQAMLHYRALFDELIDDRIGNDDVVRDVPRQNEVTPPRPRDTRDEGEGEIRRRP